MLLACALLLLNWFLIVVPLPGLAAVFELYDKNTLCGIAVFVNVCIISFGVIIWPLKYQIKKMLGSDPNQADNDDADVAETKRKVLPLVAVGAILIAAATIASGFVLDWWYRALS